MAEGETPRWRSPRQIAKEILREQEGFAQMWKAGDLLLMALVEVSQYGDFLKKRAHEGVMACEPWGPLATPSGQDLCQRYRELRDLGEAIEGYASWLRNAATRIQATAEALRGIPLTGLITAAEEMADPPQVIARAVPVRSHTVYGLVSSAEPNRVRYVGQSVAPARRMDDHASATAAPAVREWFQATLAAGHEVWMIRLAEVGPELASRAEQDWIAAYVAREMADLNIDRRRRLQRVA